jgi:hypothetical protein
VHDHAYLIGLHGQPHHPALLIDGGQGGGPMTSMGAHEVVDALCQMVPNIIMGLSPGCLVHAMSRPWLTMPLALRGACAIDGFVVNIFDDSSFGEARAAG